MSVQTELTYLDPIDDWEQLKANVKFFEDLRYSGNLDEFEFFQSLLHRGLCFVAYMSNGDLWFAPSRFCGYKDINREKYHKARLWGIESDSAISKVIGAEPANDNELEKQFFEFCKNMKVPIDPRGISGVRRRFWNASKKLIFDRKEKVVFPINFAASSTFVWDLDEERTYPNPEGTAGRMMKQKLLHSTQIIAKALIKLQKPVRIDNVLYRDLKSEITYQRSDKKWRISIQKSSLLTEEQQRLLYGIAGRYCHTLLRKEREQIKLESLT